MPFALTNGTLGPRPRRPTPKAPPSDRQPRVPPLRFLRDALWLRPDRALAWCQILAIAAAAFTGLRWLLVAWDIPFLGDPRNVDFASFWTAADLARQGHADWAYLPAEHMRAQGTLPGNSGEYAAFFYPPGFLLLCLPLALAPFFPALAIWLTGTGLTWLLLARRYLPARAGWLGLLAFPAAWNNIWHGQNAFLSTALLAAGGLTLDRRPFLAGICLGCLSYKPQIGLLVAPTLLASRRWMALAGAATGAIVLNGAAWLAFGTQTWAAFLANTALARQSLEQELVGNAKMQSLFAALRLLGAGIGPSYAAQTVLAALVLGVVMALAWRRPGGKALAALIAAGTMLTSPFILDYDFVLLSLPIGWILIQAERTGGFLPWEKTTLAAAFIASLLVRSIALKTSLSLAPLILIGFFLVVARRLWRQTETSAPSGASP